MSKVERVRTPLSPVELAHALFEGYVRAIGSLPTRVMVRAAWAQNALELGQGRYLYDNNFGNITADASWKASGDYSVIRVAERLDKANHPDKWTTVSLAFRAYPDAVSGAAGYWKLLAGAHYRSVLALFEAGDTVGAAYQLSALGYFSAHVEDTKDSSGRVIPGYASTMKSLAATFDKVILSQMKDWQEPAASVSCPAPDESEAAMYGVIPEAWSAELLAEGMVILNDLSQGIDIFQHREDE